MRVIVADTSPLNYLVLIGEISILPHLYGQILIPPEVLAELEDSDAPPEVRKWVRSRPDWLQISSAPISQHDHALNRLDDGERAAILLAQQQSPVLLIIDDSAGRAEANRRGIPNTGTLGVLRAAAIRR